MATHDDLRRIALALPETTEASDRTAYSVAGKQFAWSWMERIEPKKPRVPNREVIAVRTANELEKQALLAMDSGVFFTEPHYDGYPAVLVRLAAIDQDLLEDVLVAGWRAKAPRQLVATYDAGRRQD
ncbi:MAG: hypothetical protein M3P14_11770 [Chloroflexota bacterium]|nr:hypothetical protein [Chloroflexota bacterium]